MPLWKQEEIQEMLREITGNRKLDDYPYLVRIPNPLQHCIRHCRFIDVPKT